VKTVEVALVGATSELSLLLRLPGAQEGLILLSPRALFSLDIAVASGETHGWP